MGLTCACLVGWKQRRTDTRAETHWRKIADVRSLSSYEQYQRDWNFIETDYGERPSSNGIDPANPGFAWTSNLARHIVTKVV